MVKIYDYNNFLSSLFTNLTYLKKILCFDYIVLSALKFSSFISPIDGMVHLTLSKDSEPENTKKRYGAKLAL